MSGHQRKDNIRQPSLAPRRQTVLSVPADIEEMRFDLSCERLIKLTGKDRKGRPVSRYLRVTHSGGITVV
jgi:hypothetical protein